MPQRASSSSATTISAWGVVRARTMYAVFYHATLIGIGFSILKGDWNFLLGTEFGYTPQTSLIIGLCLSGISLMALFIWKCTPAYLGGGYTK